MATGDIRSVTVLGSSDFSGRFHGWAVEIGIEGLITGGTYALGWDANADPRTSTPAIELAVSTYTFNASQSVVSDSITVYGTKETRQPYPNQASTQETVATVGVDGYDGVKIVIALSDFVYDDDTATVDIAAGFYDDGTNSNNAETAFSVTNSSTLSPPKPVAKWSWPGYRKVGTSFDIRCVAFHRSAQDGEPVKYVTFSVADEHSNAVTVTESASQIDGTMPDAHAVIEWIADVDASTLTDGDTITANFIAYPHRTNAAGTNTLDTSDGVNTQPTPHYAPQTYLLDKAGDHGYAMVDATSGNDGTGVVYSSQAAAEAGNAYQTIAAALTALASYHNINSGHNDAGGGTILLSAETHTLNSNNGGVMSAWVTIQPATGGGNTDTFVNPASTNSRFPDRCHLKNVGISTTNYYNASNADYLWLDRVDISATGSLFVWQMPTGFFTHCSGEMTGKHFRTFSTSETNWSIIRGSALDSVHASYGYCVVGNKNVQVVSPEGGNEIPVFGIYAFNSLFDTSSRQCDNLFRISGEALTTGFALVQNLYESTAAVSVPAAQLGADNSVVECSNIISWHNTYVGERCNYGYNDTAGQAPLRRFWSQRGNIVQEWNTKGDVFAEDGGNVGGWPVHYNVGTFGCLHVGASSESFRGDFDGVAVDWGGTPGYVDDKSGSTGAGNGDYHILPSGDAYNVLPATWKCLKWDIDGDLRATEPSAGAYNDATSTDALTSTDLIGSVATLGIPAIGQLHVFTASDITGSPPTVEAPSLDRIENLIASNLVGFAPSVGSTTLGQVHELIANDLLGSAAVVEPGELAQTHALGGIGILCGAATIAAPVLVEGLVELSAVDLTSDPPRIKSPFITQTHILLAGGITSGVPVIDSPVSDDGSATGYEFMELSVQWDSLVASAVEWGTLAEIAVTWEES